MSTLLQENTLFTEALEATAKQLRQLIKEYQENKQKLSREALNQSIDNILSKAISLKEMVFKSTPLANCTTNLKQSERDSVLNDDISMDVKLATELRIFLLKCASAIDPFEAFLTCYEAQTGHALVRESLIPDDKFEETLDLKATKETPTKEASIKEASTKETALDLLDLKSTKDSLQIANDFGQQWVTDLNTSFFTQRAFSKFRRLQQETLLQRLQGNTEIAQNIPKVMLQLQKRLVMQLTHSLSHSLDNMYADPIILLNVQTLSTDNALAIWMQLNNLMGVVCTIGTLNNMVTHRYYHQFANFHLNLQDKLLHDYLTSTKDYTDTASSLTKMADYYLIVRLIGLSYTAKEKEGLLTDVSFASLQFQNATANNTPKEFPTIVFMQNIDFYIPSKPAFPIHTSSHTWINAVLLQTEIDLKIAAAESENRYLIQLVGNISYIKYQKKFIEYTQETKELSRSPKGLLSRISLCNKALNLNDLANEIIANFTKAAHLGLCTAQFNLGQIYAGALATVVEGDLKPCKDLNQSFTWYKKALEERFPLAQYVFVKDKNQSVAKLLIGSTDPARQKLSIIQLTEDAAVQGLGMAQNAYSKMFRSGYCTADGKPDIKLALYWKLRSHKMLEKFKLVFETETLSVADQYSIISELIIQEFNFKELLEAFKDIWYHPPLPNFLEHEKPCLEILERALKEKDYKTAILLLGALSSEELDKTDAKGNTLLGRFNMLNIGGAILLLQFGANPNTYYTNDAGESFSSLFSVFAFFGMYKGLVAVHKNARDQKESKDKKESDKSVKTSLKIMQLFFDTLLDHPKIDLNAPIKKTSNENNPTTPLLFMITHSTLIVEQRLMLAKRLIQAGANIDAVDQFGRFPLMAAIQHEQYEMANLLLDHNANVQPLFLGGFLNKLLLSSDKESMSTPIVELRNRILSSFLDACCTIRMPKDIKEGERVASLRIIVIDMICTSQIKINYKDKIFILPFRHFAASERFIRLSDLQYTFDEFKHVLQTLIENNKVAITKDNVQNAIREFSPKYLAEKEKAAARLQGMETVEITNMFVAIKQKFIIKLSPNQEISKIFNICVHFNDILTDKITKLDSFLEKSIERLNNGNDNKKDRKIKSKQTEINSNQVRKEELKRLKQKVDTEKLSLEQLSKDFNAEYSKELIKVEEKCNQGLISEAKQLAKAFIDKYENKYNSLLNNARILRCSFESIYDAIVEKFMRENNEELKNKEELARLFEIEQQKAEVLEAQARQAKEDEEKAQSEHKRKQEEDKQRRERFWEQRKKYFAEKAEIARKAKVCQALAAKKALLSATLIRAHETKLKDSEKTSTGSRNARTAPQLLKQFRPKPFKLSDKMNILETLTQSDLKWRTANYLETLERMNEISFEFNYNFEQLVAELKDKKIENNSESFILLKLINIQKNALLEILAEVMEFIKKQNHNALFSNVIALKLRNYLFKGKRFLIQKDENLENAIKRNQDIIHMIYEIIFFIRSSEGKEAKECRESDTERSESNAGGSESYTECSESDPAQRLRDNIDSKLFQDLLKEAENFAKTKPLTLEYCKKGILYFEKELMDLEIYQTLYHTHLNPMLYHFAKNFSLAGRGTFTLWYRDFHRDSFKEDPKYSDYVEYIEVGNAVRHCDFLSDHSSLESGNVESSNLESGNVDKTAPFSLS